MADKFFHEFPTTTTLKDTSILLLDQDNQTTAITLAQLKSFLTTTNTITNVGNAEAGIFVSAVCFINGDTGSWTAPVGVTSARVTVVGGGGGAGGQGVTNGGRSHFNYPSGSIPSTNQLFADGGAFGYGSIGSTAKGGNAGWNGIVVDGGMGGVALTLAAPTVGKGGQGRNGNKGAGGGGGGAGSSHGLGVSFLTGPEFKGGAAGGINGSGLDGGSSDRAGASYVSGSSGGGIIQLSNFAISLPNYNDAITNKVGKGGYTPTSSYSGGGGGGWCTATISVTPGTSYTYVAGVRGTNGNTTNTTPAGYGMVVIEW